MRMLAAAVLALATLATHGGDLSAEAIRTLLNTRSSVGPEAYENAAKTVAGDAAAGKPLQRFIAALLSRDKDAPKALRLDDATRKIYFDSSREMIRAMAARRNNPLACYLLAMEADDVELLKKAADLGNVQAMNSYATMSLSYALSGQAPTNTLAASLRAGYEYFKKSADRNDANGLYNLGVCYMCGYHVQPDPEKGRECFLAAARQNHPEAINNLGGLYRDGVTVERDPVKAARWFAKSADLGNPYGKFNYAMALLRGEGVVQDEERAVRMLKESALEGCAEAMNAWAECLHIGRGTERDLPTAIRLYRKAADSGVAAAMDNYADCYERGDGLPRNQEAANIWRMKARAARGDRNAAAWLHQSGVE